MRILSTIKPGVAARLGMALLILPIYFISASALRLNAPGLSSLANPIILLGVLLVAFALNALSILSVNLRSDTPSVLSVSLSLRFWNLIVIATDLLLLCVMLGYAFVENFQVRAGS
jgi:hydrogenase-4 membrane subunit HyfE